MKFRSGLLFIMFLYTVQFTFSRQFPVNSWQHISIDPILPGEEWGTGGFTLADYDMDGDMDITISRRLEGGMVLWYQNTGTRWTRHYLGVADMNQLGATTTDISGDGYPDLIMGRFWFENPGVLAQDPDVVWTRYTYNGGLSDENHDIVVCDFDLDGRLEILSYSQDMGGGVLRIFNTKDPKNWTYFTVDDEVNSTASYLPQSKGIHGGFAPGGTGDLNKDKFPDIVLPSGWYMNPGKNTQGKWIFTPWETPAGVVPNLYGLSMRGWITDLDSDGDNDVVYTDCDNEKSEGYWYENIKNGSSFIRHELPSPGEPTGSFHSLAVADFDLDGDLDIFSGEQEDPDKGMKQEGLKERGFFWVNTGDAKNPRFDVKVFQIDNPGWHEVQMGDVDGDGDMDLVSKIWNKDGDHYHVDLWKNLTIN